jgi:hypothetical protein
MLKRLSVSVAVFVVLAAMTATSNADTVQVTAANASFNGGWNSTLAGDIRTDDLLQTSLSSTSFIVGSATYGSSHTKLYDGLYGSSSTTDSDFCPTSPTTTVEFLLDTTVNTKGYDISNIASLSGYWGDTRSQQVYDVYTKTATTAYSLLYSVTASLAGNVSAKATDVKVTAVGSQGGVIASGVTGIEVVFYDSGVSGYGVSVYHELDVVGTATVPEPGTLTLLAAGLLGLIAYAWRKRKS